MITFEALCQARGVVELSTPTRLLCLDPGHTTGWCVFEGIKLSTWGQTDTIVNRVGNNEGDLDWLAFEQLLTQTRPERIVCEDYRVYSHKLDRHTNSRILTIHIIGALEYYCAMHDIPLEFRLAAAAKGFVTDDKLKAWGFYQPGMRHSRDAIRHGIYELLFGRNV